MVGDAMKVVINYLLNQSEVFKEKSQAKTLPYWLSDSEVNKPSLRFEILF